jgi:glycosyltransferase involved in cell wall biosynthesis
MKYRIIAVLVTKNDGEILVNCLTRLSEFCDGIIVTDDGSSDGTAEVLKGFPKVIKVFSNQPYSKWNVFRDYNRMLAEVHRIQPEWIISIDADDLIDKRFVAAAPSLFANTNVGRYTLKEVTLWGNKSMYRIDKPELYGRSGIRGPYILRYNPGIRLEYIGGNEKYKTKILHAFRQNAVYKLIITKLFPIGAYIRMKDGVIKRWLKLTAYPQDHYDITHIRITGEVGNYVMLDYVKVHYHFYNFQYAAKKHMDYVLNVALKQKRTEGEIALLSSHFTKNFNDEGLKLAPVDREWGVL